MFKPKVKLASYDGSVVNGVKQDSSGSGKKTDNQCHLKCKEVENQWFVNAIDYPVDVLASELRDQWVKGHPILGRVINLGSNPGIFS